MHLASAHSPKATLTPPSVLKRTQQYYTRLKNFKVHVDYTDHVKNPPLQGKLYVSKEKYRLLLPDQEIINDGKTVWNYLLKEKELTINHASKEATSLSPAYFYHLDAKKYQTTRLERNKNFHLLQLTPRRKKKENQKGTTEEIPHVQKIILKINAKNFQIDQASIYYHSAEEERYSFTHLEVNLRLPQNFFTFNHQTTDQLEIIDLR